jgi:phage recombination protein Bet
MSEPTNQKTAVEKRESTAVEYIPYGAQDKIKLNISIVQNLIAVKTKSGKTCSDRDAVKFLAMCQAKRMNPFEGDCYLIGYDTRDGAQFALVTAHQTYLKRAELHPEFDGMKSGLIVEQDGELKDLEGDFYGDGQHVVGGWATVFFKNRKQPMHKRLRMERFKKPFGIWLDDAAGMICKCAEADALRSSFPTMLGGLYLREEIQAPDVQTTRPDFAPVGTRALFSTPAASTVDAPQPEPEPSQEQHGEPDNVLDMLRTDLERAKISEGALLDYLASSGTTDGSPTSLEELSMSYPSVLTLLVEQWDKESVKIAGLQKKGGK